MQQNNPGKKIKDYELIEKLGQGSFSEVWKAKNFQSGELVAVKILKKEKLYENPKLVDLFITECAILKQISHTNIVKYIDSFETQNNVYLVEEFCNEGDLVQLIKSRKNKCLPEQEAVQLFAQLIDGFSTLHQFNIMHRE